MKAWVKSTLAAALVAGGVWAWHAGFFAVRPQAQAQISTEPATRGNAAATVETATARAAQTTRDLDAIGSLQSDESVQVAPEIAGRIASFEFVEGQAVKAGDVLVRLDKQLVAAEVADAEARFNLAKANNDRATTLARTGAVSGRTRDEALANLETGTAALELAKARLAKHDIKAPFDGMVGIRRASPGAYVAIGTPIVNLEKIDKLKLDFKLPELFLSEVTIGQTVEVTFDALPGKTFSGEIYVIDPAVDVNGRALQIRAKIKNDSGLLRPGLFARIRVKGTVPREVVLVPESAIVPRNGETLVYRVENSKAVETQVTLGERTKGTVEITGGLTAGAVVVTVGQQKLRDGADVSIVSASKNAEQDKTGS